MQQGDFIWQDLSTFNPGRARKDYARLFGWSFTGNRSYKFALNNDAPIAAFFEMPRKLAKIGMPSFWMSYVAVDDLAGAVEKARRHEGAIVEIEPQAFKNDARISLIRDPSGAGFTLYEGPQIAPALGKGAGLVSARYHHLPDLAIIKSFYEDLFQWSFEQIADDPWPLFEIKNHRRSINAFVEEVPETVRGKYRYWMPVFSIASKEAFLVLLKRLKGSVASELPDGRIIVADRQGAHFMVRE